MIVLIALIASGAIVGLAGIVPMWMFLQQAIDQREFNINHGRNGDTRLIADGYVRRAWAKLYIVVGNAVFGGLVTTELVYLALGGSDAVWWLIPGYVLVVLHLFIATPALLIWTVRRELALHRRLAGH